MNPTDLTDTVIGQIFATQIAGLPTGAIDAALFRASRRADGFTKRRLQAPGATTIGIAGCSVGATSIPLVSTLGIDNLEEQAIIVGTGGTQETLLITPGSVKPTTPLAYPYPGTVTVSPGCQFNHSSEEPVQCVYIETRMTGSSSGQDLYEDVVTQQAQIAAAHAGGYVTLTGDRTRHFWLDQYPLGILYAVEHAYPYTNEFEPLDVSALLIEDPTFSHMKVGVGVFMLAGGMLKATYTAGYQTVSEDIQEAVTYYLADELRLMKNPENAIQHQMGKRNIKLSNIVGKSQYVYQAEEALKEYVR